MNVYTLTILVVEPITLLRRPEFLLQPPLHLPYQRKASPSNHQKQPFPSLFPTRYILQIIVTDLLELRIGMPALMNQSP
jgi:hypothetical protein